MSFGECNCGVTGQSILQLRHDPVESGGREPYWPTGVRPSSSEPRNIKVHESPLGKHGGPLEGLSQAASLPWVAD